MTEIERKLEAEHVAVQDATTSKLWALADSDGSGALDQKEFEKFANAMKHKIREELATEQALKQKNAMMQRRAKIMIVVGVVMLVFLGVSIASTAVLTSWIVDRAVPMGTGNTSSALLTSKEAPNEIVQVQSAQHSFPLLAATYLPPQYLNEIKTISVHRSAIPIDEAEPEDTPQILSTYSITGYDQETGDEPKNYKVTFHTSRGDTIIVDGENGASIVVAALGKTFEACAADTACASFKVDDEIGAYRAVKETLGEDLLDDLITELEEEFDEESPILGRQLWGGRRGSRSSRRSRRCRRRSRRAKSYWDATGWAISKGR